MVIENKKKFILQIFKLLLFVIIVIFLAIALAKYIIDNDYRDNINSKVLRREIYQEKLNTIEIDSENNLHVYAFDNYIAVLGKSELILYYDNSEKYASYSINLINPIEAEKGKYLVLAEDGGTRIYLISELGINWEIDTDGNIYNVAVNENGYVTALVENATYQSICIVYDSNGNELFKVYSEKDYMLSSEISEDNKYLGIGQINYSGTVIKSMIKYISIEMAKKNSKEAVLNTYESESGKILINMKFNTKNELICEFNSYIEKITDLTQEKIYDIGNNDIFVDINSKNNCIIAQKENSGLFSYEYQININSTIGKSNNLYILEKDVPKKIIVSENIFCIILGNELRIVKSNGWLLKKYMITRDIQNIVIGNNIIGLVYNNKIEIINL